MKIRYLIAGSLAALSLVACHKPKIDFSFTPASPRAGDSIVFTNLCEEGESWLWEFGDGASSTLKQPKRAYKRAGTFLVTLTVDNKKELSVSHNITIYDTVPVITTDSEVNYMTLTTFTPIIYNPYSYKIQYEWHFSKNVFGDDVVDGIATVKAPRVYFMEKDFTDTVRLIVKINGKTYDVSQPFFVHNVPAPALVYTTTSDSLFVQRTFEKGWEDPQGQSLSNQGYFSGQEMSLEAEADYLYVFRGDRTSTGKIYRYNLANKTLQTVISNAGNAPGNGFFYGKVDHDSLYWTDQLETIYRCSKSATNLTHQTGLGSPYFFASASQLPYDITTGKTSGGISMYTNYLILWCYDQSVYLFYPNELGTDAHVQNAILEGREIKQIQVDKMNKKVYFCDDQGLWVANLSDTQVQLIDAKATGAFCVDNATNYLYFAHTDSVMGMPLLNRNSSVTQLKRTTLNYIHGVSAITKDNVQRK